MFKRMKLPLGILLCLVSFLFAFVLNLPTATGEEVLTFTSHYGEKEVTLSASYYEIEGAQYAALICPGYSCDRQKWRPVSDLLVGNGITTMTLDYSGQGASYGTIGFDNADSDRIAEQIADAIKKLRDISGIDYDHIILVGHSMGGRSILRLLYDINCPDAVTNISAMEIRTVLLLSPEVNYYYNAQASLFAGTSDSQREPWSSFNASYITGTDVYLFGSTADDIVSDEDVLALAKRLGASNLPESGVADNTSINENGNRITTHIVNGMLHSYMMYSPRIAAKMNECLEEITGTASVYPAVHFGFIHFAWVAGMLGMCLTLSGAIGHTGWIATNSLPVLTDPSVYLRRKALLWIPGFVLSFLICCLCVLMPFGSPVMNIPYMCCIAGYGFVMLFAYRKGLFPGTKGKLPSFDLHILRKGREKELLKCFLFSTALCFVQWYVLRATMYRLIPLNARLFWVCVAAVLMTVAYYVAGCENDMFDRALTEGAFPADRLRRTRLLYNVIQYVPLLLLTLFYAILKSYSGMIGQIQNIVLMYTFCIPLGNYIKIRTGNRLLGALITGFLFQTIMITSAALISFF